MLDTKQAPSFIKDINNTQGTDETVLVKSVLARHKETNGENDWLRNGPNNQQPSSPADNKTAETPANLDWQLAEPRIVHQPHWEELKKFVANVAEETEARYRQDSLTNTILETMAKGNTPTTTTVETPANEQEIDMQITRYEMPSVSKSDSGSRRIPTSYENWTLNPRVLLLGAIMENTLHVGPRSVPRCIYVHDDILKQLPENMRLTSGEDFDGTLPFREFGRDDRIPVLSAKEFLGVDLPRNMVWCSN